MYSLFLKIASHTQETENVCLWINLLKYNQVRQFVKLMISSTLRTYERNWLRPGQEDVSDDQ